MSGIDDAFAAWATLLGAERVLRGDAAGRAFGVCTTGATRRIAGALRPATVGMVAPLVRIANHHRIALYPVSTGHNWGYGTALPARDDCVIVDLSAMRAIRHFDVDAGVVTVEPGVTHRMLSEYLGRAGLPFLVPVHGAGPEASLVGNALERGFGITPFTDHFGAVLALEAVLPDGSTYRSPLPELAGMATGPGFKWGIGPYLDGLFTQGGFGVVTSMSLALARRPEAVKAMLFGVSDAAFDASIAAVREVMRRLPGVVGGINLMNARRVLSMAIPYPAERRGRDGILPGEVVTTLARAHRVQPWTGFGTLYGTPRVVAAAQRDIARLLRPHVRQLAFVSEHAVRGLNRARRRMRLPMGGLGRKLDLLESGLELVAGVPNETALPLAYWRSGRRPASGTLDPARDGCGLAWYAPLVPMTAEAARRYVTLVEARMAGYGMEPLVTLTTIGDRCFDSTVPILFDRSDAAEVARAAQCARELLVAGQAEGFVPYRIGIDAMDWLAGQGLAHGALVRRLKAAVDPAGILAPGRYDAGDRGAEGNSASVGGATG